MRMFAKTLSALAFFGGMTVLRADTTAPAKPTNSSEMRNSAVTLRAGIDADHQRIITLREQARKLKDVIKLNCVNDKLVEANAQVNIADSANEQLQVALDKNSDDRQTLFQGLSDASTSLKQLRESAAACIGTPELSKQASGVVVQRPDIPDDPGNYTPGNGEYGPFEPPAYASPWI
jgi:hypothetical protein